MMRDSRKACSAIFTLCLCQCQTATTFLEASLGCGWCRGFWISGFYFCARETLIDWFTFVSATTAGLGRSRILK